MNEEQNIFIEKKNPTLLIVVGVLAVVIAVILTYLLSDDTSAKKRTIQTYTPPVIEKQAYTMTEDTPIYEDEVEAYRSVEEEPATYVEPEEVTSSVAVIEDYPDNEATDNVELVETTYIEYVIQKNDTLYDIAKERYGASHYWALIYEANEITDPDKIYAGKTLRLPVRHDGNLSWDTKSLVNTYIEIYKVYDALNKISDVKYMLLEAVRRIDPERVALYLDATTTFRNEKTTTSSNDDTNKEFYGNN